MNDLFQRDPNSIRNVLGTPYAGDSRVQTNFLDRVTPVGAATLAAASAAGATAAMYSMRSRGSSSLMGRAGRVASVVGIAGLAAVSVGTHLARYQRGRDADIAGSQYGYGAYRPEGTDPNYKLNNAYGEKTLGPAFYDFVSRVEDGHLVGAFYDMKVSPKQMELLARKSGPEGGVTISSGAEVHDWDGIREDVTRAVSGSVGVAFQGTGNRFVNAAAGAVIGGAAGYSLSRLRGGVSLRRQVRNTLIGTAVGAVIGAVQNTQEGAESTEYASAAISQANRSLSKLYGSYADTGEGYGLSNAVPAAVVGGLVASAALPLMNMAKATRSQKGLALLLGIGAGAAIGAARILNAVTHQGMLQGRIGSSMRGAAYKKGEDGLIITHTKMAATKEGSREDKAYYGTANLGWLGKGSEEGKRQFNVGVITRDKNIVSQIRQAIKYINTYKDSKGHKPAPYLKDVFLSGRGTNIKERLHKEIRESKGPLKVSVAYATDKDLFAILKKEAKEGRKIELYAQSPYGKRGGGATDKTANEIRSIISFIRENGLQDSFKLYMNTEQADHLLHAKVVTADNLSILGSYNFSTNAELRSFEMMVKSADKGIISTVNEALAGLVKSGTVFSYDFSGTAEADEKNRLRWPKLLDAKTRMSYETSSFAHLFKPGYTESDASGRPVKRLQSGQAGVMYMPQSLPDSFFIANPNATPSIYSDRFAMLTGQRRAEGLQGLILRSADRQLMPEFNNLEGLGTLINQAFGQEIYEEGLGAIGTALRIAGRVLDVATGYHAMKEIHDRQRGKYIYGDPRGLQKLEYKENKDVGFFESLAMTTVKTVGSTSASLLFYFGLSHTLSMARANLESTGISAILAVPEHVNMPSSMIRAYENLFSEGHLSIIRTAADLAEHTKLGMGEALQEMVEFSALRAAYLVAPGTAPVLETMKSTVSNIADVETIDGPVLKGDIEKLVYESTSEVNYRYGVFNTLTYRMQLDLERKYGTSYLNQMNESELRAVLDDSIQRIVGYDKFSGELQLLDDPLKARVGNKAVVPKGGGLLTGISHIRNIDASNFMHGIRPILEIIAVANTVQDRTSFVSALTNLEKVISQKPVLKFVKRGENIVPEVTAFGIDRVTELARSLDEIATFIPANPLFYIPQIRDAFNIQSLNSGSEKGDDLTLKSFIGPGFQHIIEYSSSVYRNIGKLFGKGIGQQIKEVNWLFSQQERMFDAERALMQDFDDNMLRFVGDKDSWGFVQGNMDRYISANEVHRNVAKVGDILPDRVDRRQLSAYRGLRKFLGVGFGLFAVDRILDAYVMQNQGVDLITQVAADFFGSTLGDAPDATDNRFYKDKSTKDSSLFQQEYQAVIPSSVRLPIIALGALAGSKFFYEFDVEKPFREVSEKAAIIKDSLNKARDAEVSSKQVLQYPRQVAGFAVESKDDFTEINRRLGLVAELGNLQRVKLRGSAKGAVLGGLLAIAGTQVAFSLAAAVLNTAKQPWRTPGMKPDPAAYATVSHLASARRRFMNAFISSKGKDYKNVSDDKAVAMMSPEMQYKMFLSMLSEETMMAGKDDGKKPIYAFATQVPNPIFQFALVSKLDTQRNTMALGAGFQFLPLLGAGAVPQFPLMIRVRALDRYQDRFDEHFTAKYGKDSKDPNKLDRSIYNITKKLEFTAFVGDQNSEFTNALIIGGAAAWARYGIDKASTYMKKSKLAAAAKAGGAAGSAADILAREIKALGPLANIVSVGVDVTERAMRWSQLPMLAMPNIVMKAAESLKTKGLSSPISRAWGPTARKAAPFLLSYLYASSLVAQGGTAEAVGSGYEAQYYESRDYIKGVSNAQAHRLGVAVGFAGIVGGAFHVANAFGSASSMIDANRNQMLFGFTKARMYQVYEDHLFTILSGTADKGDSASATFAGELKGLQEEATAQVGTKAAVGASLDSLTRKTYVKAYNDLDTDLQRLTKKAYAGTDASGKATYGRVSWGELTELEITDRTLPAGLIDDLEDMAAKASSTSTGLSRALFQAKESTTANLLTKALSSEERDAIFRRAYTQALKQSVGEVNAIRRAAEPAMFRTGGLRLALMGEVAITTMLALHTIGTVVNTFTGWGSERAAGFGVLDPIAAFLKGMTTGVLSMASGTDPNSQLAERERIRGYQDAAGLKSQAQGMDSSNFLKKLFSPVLAPFAALATMLKIPGVYRDDLNAFANLAGPLGVTSRSNSWSFYTQIQSTAADVNVSKFYMDLKPLRGSMMKRMQATMDQSETDWFAIMNSMEHKIARKSPMTRTNALSASEREAIMGTSPEMYAALSVRQFMGQHIANQWGDELLYRLLGEMYRTGRVKAEFGKFKLPQQKYIGWTPWDSIAATLHETATIATKQEQERKAGSFEFMKSMMQAGRNFLATGSAEQPLEDLTGMVYGSRGTGASGSSPIKLSRELIRYFTGSAADNIQKGRHSEGAVGVLGFLFATAVTSVTLAAFGYSAATMFSALTALQMGGDLHSIQREVAEKSVQISTSPMIFDADEAGNVVARMQRLTYESKPFITTVNQNMFADRIGERYWKLSEQQRTDTLKLVAERANYAVELARDDLRNIVSLNDAEIVDSLSRKNSSEIVELIKTRYAENYARKVSVGRGHADIELSEFFGFTGTEALEDTVDRPSSVKKLLDMPSGPMAVLEAKLSTIYSSDVSDAVMSAKTQLAIATAIQDTEQAIWSGIGPKAEEYYKAPKPKAPKLDPLDVFYSRQLIYNRDPRAIAVADVVNKHGILGATGKGIVGGLKLVGGSLDVAQIYYPLASGITALGDEDEIQRRRAAYALGGATTDMTFAALGLKGLSMLSAAGPMGWAITGAVVAAGVAAFVADQRMNKGRLTKMAVRGLTRFDERVIKPFERTISSIAHAGTSNVAIRAGLRVLGMPFRAVDPIFTNIHRMAENTGWANLTMFFIPHTTESRLAVDVTSQDPVESAWGDRQYETSRYEIDEYWRRRNIQRRTQAFTVTSQLDPELVHPFLMGGTNNMYANVDPLQDRVFDNAGYGERILSGFRPTTMLSGTMILAARRRQQLAAMQGHGNYAGGAADATPIQPGPLYSFLVTLPAAASRASRQGSNTALITELADTVIKGSADASILGAYVWAEAKSLFGKPGMLAKDLARKSVIGFAKYRGHVDPYSSPYFKFAQGINKFASSQLGKSLALGSVIYLLGNVLASKEKDPSKSWHDHSTEALAAAAVVVGFKPFAKVVGKGVADGASLVNELAVQPVRQRLSEVNIKFAAKTGLPQSTARALGKFGTRTAVGAVVGWFVTNSWVQAFGEEYMTEDEQIDPDEQRRIDTLKAGVAGGVALSFGGAGAIADITGKAFAKDAPPVPSKGGLFGRVLGMTSRVAFSGLGYGALRGFLLGSAVSGLLGILTLKPEKVEEEKEREKRNQFITSGAAILSSTFAVASAVRGRTFIGNMQLTKVWSAPVNDFRLILGAVTGALTAAGKFINRIPLFAFSNPGDWVRPLADVVRGLNQKARIGQEVLVKKANVVGRWLTSNRARSFAAGFGAGALESVGWMVTSAQLGTLNEDSLRTEFQAGGRAFTNQFIMSSVSIGMSSILGVKGVRTPMLTAMALTNTIGEDYGGLVGDAVADEYYRSGGSGVSNVLQTASNTAAIGSFSIAAYTGAQATYQRLAAKTAAKTTAKTFLQKYGESIGSSLYLVANLIGGAHIVYEMARDRERAPNEGVGYATRHYLDKRTRQIRTAADIALAGNNIGSNFFAKLAFTGRAGLGQADIIDRADFGSRLIRSGVIYDKTFKDAQRAADGGTLIGAAAGLILGTTLSVIRVGKMATKVSVGGMIKEMGFAIATTAIGAATGRDIGFGVFVGNLNKEDDEDPWMNVAGEGLDLLVNVLGIHYASKGIGFMTKRLMNKAKLRHEAKKRELAKPAQESVATPKGQRQARTPVTPTTAAANVELLASYYESIKGKLGIRAEGTLQVTLGQQGQRSAVTKQVGSNISITLSRRAGGVDAARRGIALNLWRVAAEQRISDFMFSQPGVTQMLGSEVADVTGLTENFKKLSVGERLGVTLQAIRSVKADLGVDDYGYDPTTMRKILTMTSAYAYQRVEAKEAGIRVSSMNVTKEQFERELSPIDSELLKDWRSKSIEVSDVVTTPVQWKASPGKKIKKRRVGATQNELDADLFEKQHTEQQGRPKPPRFPVGDEDFEPNEEVMERIRRKKKIKKHKSPTMQVDPDGGYVVVDTFSIAAQRGGNAVTTFARGIWGGFDFNLGRSLDGYFSGQTPTPATSGFFTRFTTGLSADFSVRGMFQGLTGLSFTKGARPRISALPVLGTGLQLAEDIYNERYSQILPNLGMGLIFGAGFGVVASGLGALATTTVTGIGTGAAALAGTLGQAALIGYGVKALSDQAMRLGGQVYEDHILQRDMSQEEREMFDLTRGVVSNTAGAAAATAVIVKQASTVGKAARPLLSASRSALSTLARSVGQFAKSSATPFSRVPHALSSVTDTMGKFFRAAPARMSNWARPTNSALTNVFKQSKAFAGSVLGRVKGLSSVRAVGGLLTVLNAVFTGFEIKSNLDKAVGAKTREEKILAEAAAAGSGARFVGNIVGSAVGGLIGGITGLGVFSAPAGLAGAAAGGIAVGEFAEEATRAAYILGRDPKLFLKKYLNVETGAALLKTFFGPVGESLGHIAKLTARPRRDKRNIAQKAGDFISSAISKISNWLIPPAQAAESEEAALRQIKSKQKELTTIQNGIRRVPAADYEFAREAKAYSAKVDKTYSIFDRVKNFFKSAAQKLKEAIKFIRNSPIGQKLADTWEGVSENIDDLLNWDNQAPKPVGSRSDLKGIFAPLLTTVSKGEGGWESFNRGRAGDSSGRSAKQVFGKNLRDMTIAEIMRLQSSGRVFAVGRFQFIPKTLRSIVKGQKVDTSAKFTEATQQRLAILLIKQNRPTVWKYLMGQNVPINRVVDDLANEWVSLKNSRGGNRFNGISGNRATGAVSDTIRALQETRANVLAAKKSGTFSLTPPTQDAKSDSVGSGSGPLTRRYASKKATGYDWQNKLSKRGTPTHIVIAAGHSNKLGGGAPNEKAFMQMSLQALREEAARRGVKLEVLDPKMTQKMTLTQVYDLMRQKERGGAYAVEIHADADAAYGRSGIITGKAVHEADHRLAREFGAFRYAHREGGLGGPPRGISLLELASMYDINRLTPAQRVEAAREQARRFFTAIYGEDKRASSTSAGEGWYTVTKQRKVSGAYVKGGKRLTPAAVTSGYLHRGGKHKGVDVPRPTGTAISFTERTKVVGKGFDAKGWGHYIMVQFADGRTALAGHLMKASDTRVGQILDAGMLAGQIGSTGRSTGPHLHLEIRTKPTTQRGYTIDPTPYLGRVVLGGKVTRGEQIITETVRVRKKEQQVSQQVKQQPSSTQADYVSANYYASGQQADYERTKAEYVAYRERTARQQDTARAWSAAYNEQLQEAKDLRKQSGRPYQEFKVGRNYFIVDSKGAVSYFDGYSTYRRFTSRDRLPYSDGAIQRAGGPVKDGEGGYTHDHVPNNESMEDSQRRLDEIVEQTITKTTTPQQRQRQQQQQQQQRSATRPQQQRQPRQHQQQQRRAATKPQPVNPIKKKKSGGLGRPAPKESPMTGWAARLSNMSAALERFYDRNLDRKEDQVDANFVSYIEKVIEGAAGVDFKVDWRNPRTNTEKRTAGLTYGEERTLYLNKSLLKERGYMYQVMAHEYAHAAIDQTVERLYEEKTTLKQFTERAWKTFGIGRLLSQLSRSERIEALKGVQASVAVHFKAEDFKSLERSSGKEKGDTKHRQMLRLIIHELIAHSVLRRISNDQRYDIDDRGQSSRMSNFLKRMGITLPNEAKDKPQARTDSQSFVSNKAVEDARSKHAEAQKNDTIQRVASAKAQLPSDLRQLLKDAKESGEETVAQIKEAQEKQKRDKMNKPVRIAAATSTDLDMSSNYKKGQSQKLLPKDVKTIRSVRVETDANDNRTFLIEHAEATADMQYYSAGVVQSADTHSAQKSTPSAA